MVFKKFNLSLNHKIDNFKKVIEVDSDKSISIRSFLIGAISQNVSTIKNSLESHDVLSTIACLKKLGVKITKIKAQNYLIAGRGIGSLIPKQNTILNFGNSGTLARLLIGILSTTPNVKIKVLGDKSLNNRSMKQLISLMSKFGAFFFPKNKINFPLKLISSEMPVGIKYTAGVSAQLKSAVILAGLNANGLTKIIERKMSRDHTEKMLLQNNDVIKIKTNKVKLININGKKNLKPLNINVPNDPSSAAFFTALTLLKKNSSIKIKNVCLNQTRIGFFKLLKKHGAKINFQNLKKQNNEVVGNIIVRSSKLKPIKASKDYYVNSTDEYPILFVIASLINGISIFSGIGDLANKESNRIKEMQRVLKQIGIKSVSSNNQIKIYGSEKINLIKKKILIPNLGDHRICMSAFILATLTGVKTKITNFETVFTSSPSFLKIMKNLGAKFEIE
tara:strand:+ start:2255 stop:3598 length:1344 start_codon:yes stop_codon:yes gene_type:complete